MLGWLRRLFGVARNDAARSGLPEQDAYEPVDLSGDERAVPFAGAYVFNYIDGKGQRSRRTVDVTTLMIMPSGDAALFGRCRDRRANRTFYASRMHDLADAVTGELLEQPARDLVARWQASPFGIADAACKRFDDALVVMLFIGRTTGRLSPKTATAIVQWLADQPEGTGADIPTLRRYVVDRDEPRQADWRRALRELAAAAPDVKAALAPAIGSLRPAKSKPDALRETLIGQALEVLQP